MKKLLALLLSLLMATSLCIFAGCEIVFVTGKSSNNSSNNASDDSSSTSEDAGKVDLIGISASVNTEAKAQSTQKTSALSLTSSYTNLNVKPMHNNDELLDKTDDYLAIFKDQTIINFTIKLNNPYDYYIMDFRLVAEDEEVEYYTSEKTWKPIKDRDIRWMGSDNETCTYILKLPTPEATPSNIKIKWMYYTDKHEGRNKFAVNLNNRDRYTIYKVDSEVRLTTVKFVDVKNPICVSDDNFELPIEFKIDLEDGGHIDRVYARLETGDNTIEPNEDGIYKATFRIFIDYSYTKGNVTIKTTKSVYLDNLQVKYQDEAPAIKTFEEYDNKEYFAMKIRLEGFGCPSWADRKIPTKFTYKNNNFIIDWTNNYIILELPEGKDETWCREQEVEILGNVFNVGKLADMKYGCWQIS